MPLTLGGVALAGHLLLGMTWTEALLVGAILSPTDPVFVTATLERAAVPLRLRRLLGVESGLNDGIALPVVMILLALAGHREVHILRLALEAGMGIVLGVFVAACFLWLERRSFFAASRAYEPLGGVAIAVVIFGLSRMSHANEFLAAFAGGVTLATLRPEFARALRQIGLPIAEAVKLATLLVFGAVLSVPFLLSTGLPGVAFALVALTLGAGLRLAQGRPHAKRVARRGLVWPEGLRVALVRPLDAPRRTRQRNVALSGERARHRAQRLSGPFPTRTVAKYLSGEVRLPAAGCA